MPYYYDDYDGYEYYESSDEDVDALANGLSGLTLANKESVIDCGECFSCDHLEDCDDEPEDCNDCIKILTEIGCQNKWCAKHKCRENALKCSCTTERLLTKYQNGTKSVFGHFKCKRCKKKWNSAFAWVEDGELLTQECKKCNIAMEPFKVKSKEWRGSNREEKATDPHDQDRCQRCQELGYSCNRSDDRTRGGRSSFGY